MQLEFGDQLVVVPRRIADQYLTDMETKSPRNVYFEPETYNVRNYTSLRLDYKLAVADVPSKDTAAGIEVGNYLQSLVDAVSLTQDSALGLTQVKPIFSSPTKIANPFKLQTEIRQAELVKHEMHRDEMLRKRRAELQELMSNPELVKSSRERRVALLNRSMQYESAQKDSLRTKEYLEELKRKSMEIKKIKTEANARVETDAKKSQEAVFFIKKKKVQEFVGKKTVEYTQQFAELYQKRQKDDEFFRMKTMQEEKIKPIQKKEAKEIHQSAVQEFKASREQYDSIHASLSKELQNSPNQRAVTSIFGELKLQTHAKTILENPELAQKIPNKLVAKRLIDLGIAPKIVSLKRFTELLGKSSKRQANPYHMSQAEFEALILEISIDSSVPSKPDPVFTRTRQDLARSSQLRASSVHSMVRDDVKLIPNTEVVSKVVTRQGTASPIRGGFEDTANTSSILIPGSTSPRAANNYPQRFDLGRAEMNLREILSMMESNKSEF